MSIQKTGKIAIASIQRNRNKYITEWIAFHLAVGFNQFYIYCHKTDDGMQEKLLELSKTYAIEVFSLEMDDFPQIAAYCHAWENFGDSVDWMAFIDGDEFLFPTQAHSIQEALTPYETKNLSAIGVFWKCYGSNGHIDDPEGLILESHPRHSNHDFLPNRHIKSIVRGGEKVIPCRSHVFDTAQGTYDENMRPITHGWMKEYAPSYDAFRINHYVVQSRQFFFEIKQGMGGADLPSGYRRSDAYFDEYDRNEDDDGISLKFLQKTKKIYSEINKILKSPSNKNSSENPKDAIEVVAAAESLQSQGNSQEAIQLYRQWINNSQNSTNWPIHFNLSLLLKDTGELTEAKKHLEIVISQTTDFQPAKNALALIESLISETSTPQQTMKQTPAHNIVNIDLMHMIPTDARRIVEVGCMHGAMARTYRETNPHVHYFGIDIDPDYAQVAAQFCNQTLGADIESMPAATFQNLFPSDCWIFGDCLEHLRDPWRIVRMVREAIDPNGCMLVCIPNAQHWSVQMRLATGQFRYEDSGLLDRTHIRWFTRTTLVEMFTQAGWQIEQAFSRQIPAQAPKALLDGIRAIAEAAGANGEEAVTDAQTFQYLFRLRPA